MPGQEAPIPTPANRWLKDAATRSAGRLALRDETGQELSYGELERRASEIAAAIASGAAHSGARCVVELEPGVEHAIALHGVILAGGVAQTLRPNLPEAEREAALGSWPHVVIDRHWLEVVRSRPVPNYPIVGGELADPLTRTLTSGTTGAPKAVIHSGANHLWSATASALNLGREADDRWLCCLPLDHVAGLSILIRSVIYGTAAVVHSGFDTDRVAEAMASERITLVSLVPTQLQRLLDIGAPIELPRAILVGGAPMPASALEAALEAGATVVQTYGTTETCSQICTLAPDEARAHQGSAGRVLTGSQVEIRDGEILVEGPTVATHSLAKDGMLHTGDRGRLDDDGYLWVEGRIDELIISGGENVAPEEVEDALISHPAIGEVAVVGVADEVWGQAVVGCVVADSTVEEPTAEELIEHCREQLASYKLPKAIHFYDALPRTRSGKLRRAVLAQELSSPLAAGDL